MQLLSMFFASVVNYFVLAFTNRLHLSRSRIGSAYTISSYGTYTVFRETVSLKKSSKTPVVLIVGFRLKWIRNSRFFHWLFQRCCILTTPFWSGFKGFHIKLWMVDQKTKNYLGIYEWYGRDAAQTYVDMLTHILRLVSVRHSIWYEIDYKHFKTYLNTTLVK